MRIFSTFSGIGGFEIGIENAYRNQQATEIEQNRQGRNRTANEGGSNVYGGSKPPLCVGYSEIDKYAISVYERNFPNVRNFGDITKINAKELPDFDCLVGGFPCQAFSIAGKRRGFEDTRGTLFFDLARILRAKQPRYFVFENVKGLLSHDNGNTFRTIITAIDELGYDCQWQVLNSKDYGVPQNRERVYIVGHLRGSSRPKVLPFRRATAKNNIQRDSAKTYPSEPQVRIPEATVAGFAMAKPGQAVNLSIPNSRSRRGRVSDVSPTIPARAREDGSGQPVVMIPEATKKGYAEATPGQAINLSAPNSKTRRGRVSDIAPTVDTGMQLHTLTEDVRIRRLTPVECERLQGFPDGHTAIGKDGELISDTQRYKMCGNAVTTNVVQAVFERILK